MTTNFFEPNGISTDISSTHNCAKREIDPARAAIDSRTPGFGPQQERVTKMSAIGNAGGVVEKRELAFSRKLLKQLGGKHFHAVSWVLDHAFVQSPRMDLVRKIERGIRRRRISRRTSCLLTEEVAALPPNSIDTSSAILLLAIAYASPFVASSLTRDEFKTHWSNLGRFTSITEIDSETQPLLFALLKIELPGVLCCFENFDQVSGSDWLTRFSMFVEQLINDAGWVPGAMNEQFGQLHASFLRCCIVANSLRLELSPALRIRLNRMSRNWLRLRQSNHDSLFGNTVADDFSGLVRAMRLAACEKGDDKLFQSITKKAKPRRRGLPDSSMYCDDAKVAVLRADWSAHCGKLAVAVNGLKQHVDVASRELLLHCNQMPTLSRNGELVGDVLCEPELNRWHSDKDADYLEWQMKLSESTSWRRHFFLAKRDEIAFVADAILFSKPGRLEYTSQWFLPAGAAVEQARETREIRIRFGKARALLLPLSMGEWKQDHTGDRFIVENNSIHCQQSRSSSAIFFGFAIDLNRKRSEQPATWRQLTVGEGMQIAARDRAVAFRFQIGLKQWVVYSSLTPVEGRTFLGKNLFNSFYFGRFRRDGSCDAIAAL